MSKNPDRLRAVTLNLWGEQEPLAPRQALWVAGLRALAPDVVALQEVREIPGRLPNTAATLAEALGYAHAFAPATDWGGGTEGVAILSRLPIARTEHIALPGATPDERRVLLRADVRHAAGVASIYSTHLNYRLTHGLIREAQVEAIDAWISACAAAAPERPLLSLLLGDFNATPDSDEIRFLTGRHTLAGRRTYYQDAFARLHPQDPGYTWARSNPFTERLGWLDPDRRLDYAFVSPETRDGRGRVHEARVVFDEPDAAGAHASDHYGLLVEIQAAPRS